MNEWPDRGNPGRYRRRDPRPKPTLDMADPTQRPGYLRPFAAVTDLCEWAATTRAPKDHHPGLPGSCLAGRRKKIYMWKNSPCLISRPRRTDRIWNETSPWRFIIIFQTCTNVRWESVEASGLTFFRRVTLHPGSFVTCPFFSPEKLFDILGSRNASAESPDKRNDKIEIILAIISRAIHPRGMKNKLINK